jgi:hypothetical protein
MDRFERRSVSSILMVKLKIGRELQEKIRDGFGKKTLDGGNKIYDLYSI